MDKEECIQVLLSTLQKPSWKRSNSTTDWDLRNILWNAGMLLMPDQAAALLGEIKRRGLITSRERRNDNRIVAMWGVRITPAGEDWLLHRALAAPGRRPSGPPAPLETLDPDSTTVPGTSEPEPLETAESAG